MIWQVNVNKQTEIAFQSSSFFHGKALRVGCPVVENQTFRLGP